MLGSESSTSFLLSGAKVPGNESSVERKFQGAKVSPMELSLPGVKVRGNESSIIHIWIPKGTSVTLIGLSATIGLSL